MQRSVGSTTSKAAGAPSANLPSVEHGHLETQSDLSNCSQSDWASAYTNHEMHPDGYWIDVKGTLPPELTGTYYRNGPGTYKLGEEELAHPFDGHGFILSIAIKNGKAFARTRFVETPEYKSEVTHQKILFRGSFGTQRPGGAKHNTFDIFMKNAANTSIVHWGGRLLALFEAAQPVAMDPHSLETLGPDLLGGHVKAGASFDFGKTINKATQALFKAARIGASKHGGEYRLGGEAVTAHPRYDPDTGRLVFFKYQIRMSANPVRLASRVLPGRKAALTSVITFFELDKDMNEACRVEHQAPGYTFLHDFALTPTHYVLVQNPVGLQPINFLLGKESAAASVKWQDGKPAEIHHLGRPRVTEPDSATGAATINKQQHQQSSCPGTAVGVSHGHAALDGVFDSVHQQQQQQQQQQQKCHWQQQETGSSRHQPEHLVSEVSPGFVFHHGNSYYDADTNCMITICVRYNKFPDFDEQAGRPGRSFVELDMSQQPVAQLWRYDVSVADGSYTERCLVQRAFEFPSVHPVYAGRKARYMYGGTALHPTKNLPIQAVAKFDTVTGALQLWSKGARYFMQEPQFIPRRTSEDPGVSPLLQFHNGPHSNGSGSNQFTSDSELTSTSSSESATVPKPGTNASCKSSAGAHSNQCDHDPADSEPSHVQEDDGWILAVGFDAEKQQSEVVLLDAADIEAGPIATLPLAAPVGYGIHGTWVPAYYGP